MNSDQLKKMAAEAAAQLIEPGMTVGLGTGSTADHATRYIAEKQLDVTGVPTSVMTEELAKELGIKLKDPSEIDAIDLLIDGADECLESGEMIKGGGGALLREKIIASMSQRRLYVMDDSKLVSCLGKFPLPVEINIFGHKQIINLLQQLNCHPILRIAGNRPYTTENNNYIVDCHLQSIDNPRQLEQDLSRVPGVAEVGLFIDVATDLFVASGSDVRHIVVSKQSGSSTA